MNYWYIRVYDENGKPITTRCEKAKTPQEACKLAFGTVYNFPSDTARYCNLGTRKPAYISQKKLKEITDNPDNWKLFPRRIMPETKK